MKPAKLALFIFALFVSGLASAQWKSSAEYESTLLKIHMRDYADLNEYCISRANKLLVPEQRFREKAWCRSAEFKKYLKTQYNQARLEKLRNDYFQSQPFQVLLKRWKESKTGKK